MRVTSKGRYGLKAMLDIADHGGTGRLIKSREISERQQIPFKYLEQIINILKKGGLLISVRGSEGGYRLSKSAHEITIYDVLHTLEGDLSIIDKNDSSWAKKQGSFWQELENSLIEKLNVSLSSFAEKSKTSEESNMYYI